MSYTVFFTKGARQDLFEIYSYVKEKGYPLNAKNLFLQLKNTCTNLSEMPERGHIPQELERVGVFDYREINIKVYRIIYQVIDSNVYIHCILDGRRDIQEILGRRILR